MSQLFYIPRIYDKESDALRDIDIAPEEAQRIVRVIFTSINSEQPPILSSSTETQRSLYLFTYEPDANFSDPRNKGKPVREQTPVYFLYARESKRLFSLMSSGFVEISRNYTNLLAIFRLSGATLRRDVYRFTPIAETTFYDKTHSKDVTLTAYECSTISLIQIPDYLPDPIAYIISLDSGFIYYKLAFSSQLNEGRGEGPESDYFGHGVNIVQHKTLADVLMNGIIVSLFLAALGPAQRKQGLLTLQYVHVDAEQYDILYYAAPNHLTVHTLSDIIIVENQTSRSAGLNNRSPTLICPSSLLPRGVVDTSQAPVANSIRHAGCVGNPWLYRLLALITLRY